MTSGTFHAQLYMKLLWDMKDVSLEGARALRPVDDARAASFISLEPRACAGQDLRRLRVPLKGQPVT